MKLNQLTELRRAVFSRLSVTLCVVGGVLALVAGCAEMRQPLFTGPVGLQLYSVRAQMQKDAPATLAEVHNWGFKYVELAGTYGISPSDFKSQLDLHELKAIGGHFPYDKWRDDPEGVLAEAEKLGLEYVGCAWIPHQGAFDEVVCRQAIAVFNHAGELAAQHHMKFFYHTHGYEFQPYQGGTLFDLLMKETNPNHVFFEMDIFWIAHAGQDHVKLLEKYAGRWKLMHLKDMRKGTPTGLLTGSSPVTNDVPFGEGQLDMKSILLTAQKVGVKWYFIEDESPNSEEQIPESLKWLRQFAPSALPNELLP